MNKNDQQFIAQRIRTQYMEKQTTELDALRALDGKVRRPVAVFSSVLGSIGAIVMGAGMSLVMTDIGATLGIAAALPIGIGVGVVGLAIALVNIPLHRAILESRKKKYAGEILRLSDAIINK